MSEVAQEPKRGGVERACPECGAPVVGEFDARADVMFWNDGRSFWRVLALVVLPPLTLAAVMAFLWVQLHDGFLLGPNAWLAWFGQIGVPGLLAALHVVSATFYARAGSRQYRCARTVVAVVLTATLDLVLNVVWVWYSLDVGEVLAAI